jgi:hypothetical protein
MRICTRSTRPTHRGLLPPCRSHHNRPQPTLANPRQRSLPLLHLTFFLQSTAIFPFPMLGHNHPIPAFPYFTVAVIRCSLLCKSSMLYRLGPALSSLQAVASYFRIPLITGERVRCSTLFPLPPPVSVRVLEVFMDRVGGFVWVCCIFIGPLLD